MWNFLNFSYHSDFYVKSILGGFSRAKSVISTDLQALNFDFYEFLHFLKAETYKFDKIRSPKLAKLAEFALQDPSKLVSRKI